MCLLAPLLFSPSLGLVTVVVVVRNATLSLTVEALQQQLTSLNVTAALLTEISPPVVIPVACPAGTYVEQGSSLCKSCAAGTYSGTVAASSVSACLFCGQGTYSTATGAVAVSVCASCGYGRSEHVQNGPTTTGGRGAAI